ncbi:MAG: flippase [Methylococcaceae bacterium]|nr:MAG: flippase [Methylococcaceae bacterium]
MGTIVQSQRLKGHASASQIAKGGALAFLIQGSGALLQLLTDVLAARLLGAAPFGLYALVAAWIYVLSLLGTLGLNFLLLRFVPTYLAQQDWGCLHGLLRRCTRWACLAILAITATGAVLLTLFRPALGETAAAAFGIALMIIPLQIFSSLRQAILRGFNKIGRALSPEYLLRPSLFILLLMAAHLQGWRLDALMALLLYLGAAFFAFAVGAFWQYRHTPVSTRHSTPIYHDGYWLKTAMPLLLIIGLNLISSRIDVIMLGFLADAGQVGIYSAASRIADVVVFGLVAANAVVAPMIARLHATRQHAELQKIVLLAGKGIALFTTPVAMIIILFGHEILNLFGNDFSAGYTVLVILMSGQIVNALAGPVGHLMTMTGHQVKAAKMVGVSALLNLALNGALIPHFGVIGAALATAVSTATWNLLMMRFVYAELKIRSSLFYYR